MTAFAIDDLSPAERLALIGELWDSLDESEIPLPDAQQAEIERRLATAEADAQRGKTWDELEASLTRRRR